MLSFDSTLQRSRMISFRFNDPLAWQQRVRGVRA